MVDMLEERNEYWAQTQTILIQGSDNSGLTKREFYQQRGCSANNFYHWLWKIRYQMDEAAGPKSVQLDAAPGVEDLLQIQFCGAESTRPAGIDIDAVATLLRSVQSP